MVEFADSLRTKVKRGIDLYCSIALEFQNMTLEILQWLGNQEKLYPFAPSCENGDLYDFQ